MNTQSANNSRFIELAQLLAQANLLKKQLTDKIDPDLDREVTKIGLGLHSVLVCGEIKKGKSSFINALLGIQNLVPVATNVATSCVYKVRWGKQLRYRVFYKSSTNKAKHEISPEEVSEYGTEAGNPSNIKLVSFISVECPSPLLKGGLVLIDTPGLGGLHPYHRNITLEHSVQADSVIFVTDSIESPIGQDEINFLANLKKMNNRLAFVQTKLDATDTESAIKRKDNNISILASRLELDATTIPYFLVSSALKNLADAEMSTEDFRDSGFRQVISFFSTTLKNQFHLQQADHAYDLANVTIAQLRLHVSEQRVVLETTEQGKQNELDSKLKESELKLSQLQTTNVREIQIKLGRDLAAIKDELIMELNQKIRPNGRIIDQIRTDLEDLNSASEIYAKTEELSSRTTEECQVYLKETLDSFMTQLQSLVESSVSAISSDVAITAMSLIAPKKLMVSSYETKRLASLSGKAETAGDLVKSAKTLVLHGGVGMTAASILGGLIGSVVPILGTVIGSTAGATIAGLFGAEHGFKELKKQEKDKAIQEVCNALNNLLTDLQQSVNSTVRKIFSKLETKGLEIIASIVEESRAKHAKLRSNLAKLQTADRTSLADEAKQIEFTDSLVTELERKLSRI